MKKCESLH